MLKGISQDVLDINLSIPFPKMNLMGSNPRELWIHISATKHVCSYKEMFILSEPVRMVKKLYVGNSAMFKIEPKEGDFKDEFWKIADSKQCFLHARN